MNSASKKNFAAKLMEIVRPFYPEQKRKNWDELQLMSKSLYDESDPFCEVLNIVIPVLKLVHNIRDCLEHHLSCVVVRDFEPKPDGMIVYLGGGITAKHHQATLN